MDNINIQGIDKAEILAALYNASKPLGMGVIHFRPGDMGHADAAAEIDRLTKSYQDRGHEPRLYFDYLHGRVMKVDITGDSFSPAMYDRDNGQGAAAEALAHLLAPVGN